MVLSWFKMKKSGNCYKTFERNKNFRRFAYKIGNVLCITPWYDFEKEDMKTPKLNKICAISYGLVFGVLLLSAKIAEHDPDDENIFEKLLSLFSSAISIFLTEFLIFGSTFVQQHNWEGILKKLSSPQFERVENCCNCKTITLFYVQFVLGHVFFLTGFSYQGYIWYTLSNDSFMLPFVSLVIHEYYCFLFALVASNVALVIKCLYQDLNNLLEKYSEQYWQRSQGGRSEEKFVKYILHVGKQYRYISEIVDCYNQIFGWASLLIFWHAIVQLLRCANLILDAMDEPRFSWTIFLSLLGTSTLSMVESTFIIISCAMASSAGNKLKRISHKLQGNFDVDSPSRRELFNLADIVSSHKPKFTAANFFVISKGTTLDIINITTTYLIVIIEFNAKMHVNFRYPHLVDTKTSSSGTEQLMPQNVL